MTWKDLTLKQFQQLIKLPINEMESLSMIEQIKLLNQIFTIVEGPGKLLDSEKLFTIADEYQFMTVMPEELNFEFEHDGVRYGMDGDIKNWKTIQFITMHDRVNGKSHQEVIDELHNLLAIFVRPFKNETELEDLNFDNFKKHGEVIREHMSADVAYSASLFFLTFSHELQMHLIQSSVQLAMESLQPLQDNLTNNTDSTVS